MPESVYSYVDQTLHCGSVPLADIARRIGTPTYVYSADAVLERYRAYDQAFGAVPHRVCYAVKANSNLGLLKLLASVGAGFDIVSGGELFRVLKAGGDPDKIVFSGVGKTAQEIEYALENKIHSFNAESQPELTLIDALAARVGMRARVALRVNPDVDATTHPYISTGLREHKFGVDVSEAEGIYSSALKCSNLLLDGVSCHIGSQLLDTGPMMEAFDKVIALTDRLRGSGVPIRTLDLGGGLGVPYKPADASPSIQTFIDRICSKVAGKDLQVFIEPGR
ncbi:MAG: diaminopimelate decarboxylase, partial [Acidobacteriaceae bacterium]|nr:diaminopimelate decarboxylase [Acidobacteriaceae bacterium]